MLGRESITWCLNPKLYSYLYYLRLLWFWALGFWECAKKKKKEIIFSVYLWLSISLLACYILTSRKSEDFHFFCVVYDVTIGYKHRCPSLLDNVFGLEPSEVHIHIQRIPLHQIPTTENEVANWLMDTFSQKDQLLDKFHSQGHFPQEGTEGDLSTLNCLVSIITVMLLTSISTYLTFFSSIWFKIYVSLACCFLAIATRFNVRPMPIFGHKKSSSN